MITECRECVTKALGESDIRNIYGKAQEYYVPPCAVVILSKGQMLRNGQKSASEKDASKGLIRYRKKAYDATIVFTVSLIAESEIQLDALLEKFCLNLPTRILDKNENAIFVSPAAIGYDEDESFVRDEYMALVSVQFEGGIYKDVETQLINTENTEISMEVGKNG